MSINSISSPILLTGSIQKSRATRLRGSSGSERERLRLDLFNGEEAQKLFIAIRRLGEPEALKSPSQIKLGCRKICWVPLSVQVDDQPTTVLVNIKSAVKRLRFIGYSKSEVIEGLRTGDLLRQEQLRFSAMKEIETSQQLLAESVKFTGNEVLKYLKDAPLARWFALRNSSGFDDELNKVSKLSRELDQLEKRLTQIKNAFNEEESTPLSQRYFLDKDFSKIRGSIEGVTRDLERVKGAWKQYQSRFNECSQLEKELSQIQIKMKPPIENDIYLPAYKFKISRSLWFVPDGRIFVLFNRCKLGDETIGVGKSKLVKKTLDFKGRVFACARMREDAALEIKNLEPFQGVPGFIQLLHWVSYPDKNGKVKFRLLFKLYERGDLDKVMREELTHKEREHVTGQLLQALATMHEMGYIHRDIKPGNILIHEKGSKIEAVIADLSSVCKDSDKLTKNQCFLTYRWASPEYAKAVIHHQNLVSFTTDKNDVWALGLILHQMYIKSEPPWFNRSTGNKILRSLVKKTSEEWFEEPQDPQSVQHLIWEMLQTDPQKRLSAKEAKQKWDAIR